MRGPGIERPNKATLKGLFDQVAVGQGALHAAGSVCISMPWQYTPQSLCMLAAQHAKMLRACIMVRPWPAWGQ